MIGVEALPSALYTKCVIHGSCHPMHAHQGRVVHVCPIQDRLSVAVIENGVLVDLIECNPTQLRRCTTQDTAKQLVL